MLENIPVLSLTILVPLIGAIAPFLLGKHESYAKYVALAFSGAAFVISLIVTYEFMTVPTTAATGYHDAGGFGEYQFYESHTWIESIGASYTVGMDGISLAMYVLTTLLTLLAVLFSWDTDRRPKAYFGLMLVLEVGVLGVFAALDYFVFYVFWEIVLIPMYFMIGVWGGPRKDYAAIKFFIYTHLASLALLISLMAIYFEAGGGAF